MICVLIVDDQPDVRLAFAFMLDALGCKVAEAPSGLGALEHLAKHQVDVVLLDLTMPDMDGVTLIREIRKRPPPHPRIVVMSGSDVGVYAEALRAAAVAGADAILVKPIRKDKLLKTIQEVMRDERGVTPHPSNFP